MVRFAALLRALALLGLMGAMGRAVAAQDSYVFASPNTRASLTDEDAQGSLTSSEELNAIAVADRIACSMARKAEISSVLGVYDASSENSFLIESDLKRDQTEYLGSLIGKYEHQEFVLLFFPQAAGHDRLWAIKTSKSLDAAIGAARRMHLTPLTVRADADGTEIWIVDMGDKFGNRPHGLAAQLGGSAASLDGAAELQGDDDRAKAAAIFDAKIGAFEQQAKRKLSSQLWTKTWHNASTRTCSTEVP